MRDMNGETVSTGDVLARRAVPWDRRTACVDSTADGSGMCDVTFLSDTEGKKMSVPGRLSKKMVARKWEVSR